jgi:hypothetical protein
MLMYTTMACFFAPGSSFNQSQLSGWVASCPVQQCYRGIAMKGAPIIIKYGYTVRAMDHGRC